MSSHTKVTTCERARGGWSWVRRLGPLVTVMLMAVPLVPLAWLMHSRNGPFSQVVTGRLFAGGFDLAHTGQAVERIHNCYLIFTVFTTMVLPYVTFVRWLSDRRTVLGYWAFAMPALALCLYLLVLLTCPFYWLIQYIQAMGFTSRRIQGLIYGVGCGAALLWLVYWGIRPPGKEP